MAASAGPTTEPLRIRLDRLATARPDVPFVAPFLVYLLLLGLVGFVPPTWRPAVILIRGVGSLAVFWALRHHLPPLGRPHWWIALGVGALAAWGWVAGQYASDALGLPRWLPFYPGGGAWQDPRFELGASDLFRTTWTCRLLVACIAVPVVEEIFWRGFMLRALINWQHFERIPLGTFTWVSFIGTSLLSMFQHPANWGVSIFCWMLFNLVFYWTRSLLCLILLHGVTNFILYLLVSRTGDWAFIW